MKSAEAAQIDAVFALAMAAERASTPAPAPGRADRLALMPKRPCLVCGRLAPGSYCDRHAPKQASRAWQGGSTRAWRTLRAQALARDGHRCVQCGRTGQLHEGLTTLCETCHHAQH